MTRPLPEAVEVGRPEQSRRPREQPHQTVAAGGVLDDRQQRDDVGDLGGEEQPPETDDLVGNPPQREGVDDGGELTSLAAEDRRGATAAGAAGLDPLRDPLRLLAGGRHPQCLHLPPGGPGPRTKGGHRHPAPGAERPGSVDRVVLDMLAPFVAKDRGKVASVVALAPRQA